MDMRWVVAEPGSPSRAGRMRFSLPRLPSLGTQQQPRVIIPVDIFGTNLDLVTGLTIGSQLQPHAARTVSRVWQNKEGAQHTEEVGRVRGVAPSSHADSHMVAMRVDVSLPRDIAHQFAGSHAHGNLSAAGSATGHMELAGPSSSHQAHATAGMSLVSSQHEQESNLYPQSAKLSTAHRSSSSCRGTKRQYPSGASPHSMEAIPAGPLGEGLKSAPTGNSQRQQSAEASVPKEPHANTQQQGRASAPVLTIKLHTDFSTHVQAATRRMWQVWLVGDSHTCSVIWQPLQRQAAADPAALPDSAPSLSAGMVHLHVPYLALDIQRAPHLGACAAVPACMAVRQ